MQLISMPGHVGLPIHHFDLYRLSKAADLQRLELASSFSSAVSLVEWAERLGSALPQQHLAVSLRVLDQVSIPSSSAPVLTLGECN